MHGLQACLFKYLTVAAFRIYAHHGEDASKRGSWRPIVMEITLLIMENIENSWNCVFEFLWEPCNIEITPMDWLKIRISFSVSNP